MSLRRGRKRRTGRWTRGGVRPRTREMWHFPKRANIGQMKAAIEIFIQGKLENKDWTPPRREYFNTVLARREFTESGAPLAPSSLRTLVALIKYFGYIYMKPSKRSRYDELIVTEAGRGLVEDPVNSFRIQMMKLQITNPVIKRFCIGLEVFPFKATLKLLQDVDYLSSEEIGYILFMKMKTLTDLGGVKDELVRFRELRPVEREREIAEFKGSPEGNVTLARAPSAGYYASFCAATGLCQRARRPTHVSIVETKRSEVSRLLRKYESETYDFGDDLELWIQYFGDPNRDAPPVTGQLRFHE